MLIITEGTFTFVKGKGEDREDLKGSHNRVQA